MKDWSGNKTAVFVTNGDSSHTGKERAERDYYATSPIAVEKLLEKETFASNIWECACGGGHVSEVLKRHNYIVYSSDIIKRDYSGQDREIDFLTTSLKPVRDFDIVTNPPYNRAREFVEKSLEMIGDGHKVAMFLKLTFLESEGRAELFKNNPPFKIYVFKKRINCAYNGNEEDFKRTSAVCYAWFIWVKGIREPPRIFWL